jgi:tagatose 1,6-diphosphate aldolase
MEKLSLGKLRGLDELSHEGIFTMCALDHRGSLKKMLKPEHPDSVSYQEMVEFKLDLCEAIAPKVSAILLDPIYGAPPALARGVLPGECGLLVSLEETGYAGSPDDRITHLLPGFGVEKVKKMGASAAKLLLYFRPDRPSSSRQLDTVKMLAGEAQRWDIPLLVEPVSYPVKGEDYAHLRSELIIHIAQAMSFLPIDVLKLEFPSDLADEGKARELCRRLNSSSSLPWVVLSGGVDFPTFLREVEIACLEGASGFLGGRALWQEATHLSSRKERQDFFHTTVRERMAKLTEVASRGTPWYSRWGGRNKCSIPVDEGWYTR